ncbi:maleylpyruvate isomerase family mycothiol-dependent enzyme [Actinomycetota bacterium Odt1-20B]
MTTLEYERYCDEVAGQLAALRATLTGADLTVTVPTCPDWTLGELARHVGRAVRWAEIMLRTGTDKPVDEKEIPGAEAPGDDDPAGLDAWLAESAQLVVGTLREVGPEAFVWTWTEARDAAFWARRMTHEVAVHRADAAIAVGVPYEVDPEVAADAIDEWLDIVRFVQRADPSDSAAELKGAGRSIHLHATDAGPGLEAEWLIEFGDDGFGWRRGHEKATVAVRGPLTEVLLAFYRRRSLDDGGVEVLGERELLDFWLERASFG